MDGDLISDDTRFFKSAGLLWCDNWYYAWATPVAGSDSRLYEFVSFDNSDDTSELFRAIVRVTPDGAVLSDVFGCFMGMFERDDHTFTHMPPAHVRALEILLERRGMRIEFMPEPYNAHVRRQQALAQAAVQLGFCHSVDGLVRQELIKHSLAGVIPVAVPERPEDFDIYNRALHALVDDVYDDM